MFARNVSIQLKPNTLTEFTRTMDSEILPLLRKQKGFRDVITFAIPGGREVLAISLWDEKENAEAYNTSAYPKVLSTLNKVVDGTPHVKVLEVNSSTCHKIAVHATA